MVSVADFDRFTFIVGAPRCGTTSLSRFLKLHPAVRFPALKEPHFFTQHDLREASDAELRRKVEREYLQRFFRHGAGRRVGADASVTYLYASEQLEPVLRLWPDSRFIVSVRDPLTMLPSLHRRMLFVGQENIPSFAEAWAATADRAEGRRIPRSCTDPRLLRYDEAPRFATYIERLFASVGRERCHVLLFDDLVADPAGQYRRLMNFAGLQPQDGVDLSPERAGRSVRLLWLQRLLKQPPGPIKEHLGAHFFRRQHKPGEAAGGALEAVMALRRRLLQWNRVEEPIEPVPQELQEEIAASFQGEVDRLGRLLNRDLSHWLQPDVASTAAAADDEDEDEEPNDWRYRRANSR